MPGEIDIDTKALQQWAADLARVSGDVEDVKRPSKDAGAVVEKEAERRAPYRSGALRRGIKTRVSQSRKGVVRTTVTSGGVPYAKRQHWVQQKNRAGDQYLWAANYVKKDEVNETFQSHVDRSIRKLDGNYG